MKVIDLTHTIKEGMPVFPGTGSPELIACSTYEGDGFKETLIKMTTHTGTHMDPPAHLYENGLTLDQFPPDHFIGKALVIDCSMLKEGEAIGIKNLEPYGEKVKQADFLLFRLGWDRYWGKSEYFGDYPCPDNELIALILEGDYKGIGFDVIGLDPVNDNDLVRHHRLFAENQPIVNIENLKNLAQCGDELFWFSCFPLKIENSDGAPIRAVAWFED